MAGNHDVVHSNTLAVNSLEEFLGPYPSNFEVITEPTEISFVFDNSVPVLLLPWICADNEQRCFEAINNTKAKICFAHLQLVGFEMHAGHVSETGHDMSLFSKFDIVATGHFHHKSSKGNIHYLGAPFPMTWADYKDARGFHVWDTQTMILEYVVNKKEIFHKIVYDDKDKSLEEVIEADFSKYNKSYIKVLVKHKENPYFFDMFIDKLEKYAVDVKIIENKISIDSDVQINDCEGIIDILKGCIAETKVEKKKKELDSLLMALYNDALTRES